MEEIVKETRMVATIEDLRQIEKTRRKAKK